ncbi:MAG: COX15/CtaA family protein [Rhodospirillales bacterium]|nr:COX15/CtaA family protein [Alphaproteobacteria bacterium]MBL6947400.1 COX15/CtaA family protein [Rhodospirillales bacterium]
MIPQHAKPVAAWLFSICALIFFMVVLGGVTRLTESGLSMVNWHPVTGWLPPLDAETWEAVFADYRQSPEYHKVNAGMTVDEFKSIFWLEYLHRLMGRMIGIVFFVPMAVFTFKGFIKGALLWKVTGLFVLGALQGVLGWYMVKSGLVDRPDVSQYRLAAHLGLALVIFAAVLWVALGLLKPVPDVPADGEQVSRRFGRAAWALLGLISVTIVSGAFVAGLDAGHVYNTFPLMDGDLIPDGLGDMSPPYLNIFENVMTVQFDHRVLAITVLLSVAVFWWRAGRAGLADSQRLAAQVLGAVVVVQLGLGISTLLLVVPISLAALHQAGAVILLGVNVWLVHEFRSGPASGEAP